jgi:cell fate (sporulation/competence/biofilm development) regulator YlbF (YheA/YmcA/DUF963 family)
MDKRTYKRINFNDAVAKYLVFNATPEKKLLNIIRDLKEAFPKQSEWKNLTENRPAKELEIMEKFGRRGNLYKKVCQSWMVNHKDLAEEFNAHFQNTDKEISTDDVVKFFDSAKKKLSLNTKDIVIFVHTYLEQVVGIQLFEESALKIEQDLAKELKN